MTKFIHLRSKDRYGNPHTRGGVTVAYVPQGEHEVRFAIARCNSTDNYCRRKGRVKAAGRLNSRSQSTVIACDNSLKPMTEIIAMLTDFGVWNGL